MRAWDDFLAIQEIELGIETVNKWLKPLKVDRFDAGNLYLEAKDSFQALWFEEHIRHKVQKLLVNNNNRKIKVHLSVQGSSSPSNKEPMKASAKKYAITPSRQFTITFDAPDPYASFEHFIVSENNKLAHKLLTNLNSELGAFNPIYLHGPKGAGKTHLLMATTERLKKEGLKVIYTRAENFTEHVVAAIRQGEMSLFRQSYRHNDVLIIDDIQVLSKKSATQEEFFHTFNTLHMDGRQIIISANCSPAELVDIEPRLVSRFEWGIVLNVFPLSRELQEKMLLQKAEFLKFPLHIKVIDFLLDSFTTGSQFLIQALEALVLRAHLNGSIGKFSPAGITAQVAKQLLQDLLEEEKKRSLTPEKAIQCVAAMFGFKVEDLLGKAQTREFVFPRQLAMHLCREKLKMPFTKIGELFNKDHSTVISSVKAIQTALDNHDNETSSHYHLLQKKLESI